MNMNKEREIEHELMETLQLVFSRSNPEPSARDVADVMLKNWDKFEKIEADNFDERAFFLKQLDYIDEYVDRIGGGEGYWIARDGTEYRADVGYGLEFWMQLSGQLRKEATKVVSSPPDTQIREEAELLKKVRAENDWLKTAIERQKSTIDSLKAQLKTEISPMKSTAEDDEDL